MWHSPSLSDSTSNCGRPIGVCRHITWVVFEFLWHVDTMLKNHVWQKEYPPFACLILELQRVSREFVFCELAFSRLRGFNILFAEEKYVNMCQLHIHIEKLRPMLITFSFSNYVFFSDLWFCFQSDVPPLLDRCDLGTILPNHVWPHTLWGARKRPLRDGYGSHLDSNSSLYPFHFTK